nr:MAG TPA: hypothetical protein [Caudoviricetes sp.]
MTRHKALGRYYQYQRRGDQPGVGGDGRKSLSGPFHRRETRRFGGSAKRPVYGAGAHRERNESGGQKKWTDR